MSAEDIHTLHVAGPGGDIAVTAQGPANGTAVLMAHSILSSSMMWDEQAALLAAQGYLVLRADTRGHGQSAATPAPYSMADLVADSVAVLDALDIAKAHYVGLSLGGMSGFGLGIHHAKRLLSLLLCDARADMPAAAGAVWPDRVALARTQGCAGLAASTVERWFGRAFLDANPAVEQRFMATASATSTTGFAGCAQAIVDLDYIGRVAEIKTRTTMIVGANDGPLPQAMRELQSQIAGSELVVIPSAGHLPNIDQPAAFNAALLAHFEQH